MNSGLILLFILIGCAIGFFVSLLRCKEETGHACDNAGKEIMDFSKYKKDMDSIAEEVEFTEMAKDDGTDIPMDT